MGKVGWCLVALSVVFSGCSDDQLIGEDGFYAFAMTQGTPAAFMGEEGEAFFVVEERIEFPIETPTDAEMAELETSAPAPYARMPWVERGDYEIEIDWVLINLMDARRDVTLQLNGINEFHEYSPGFVVVDEDLIAEFNQWERTIRLDPFERRFGTIREEELDEIAVDLATVVNGAPNPHLVVHPENQQTDPRTSGFIPEVVPALTGLRAGIRTTAASDVVIEMSIRIRDDAGKVVKNINRAWELPVPELVLPSMLIPMEEM